MGVTVMIAGQVSGDSQMYVPTDGIAMKVGRTAAASMAATTLFAVVTIVFCVMVGM